MKAIINGVLITHRKQLSGQVLLYDDRIRAVIPQNQFIPAQDMEIIDAGGAFVAPGFINIHIHGCAGRDVMDEDAGAIGVMCDVLPATGVTSFLATTMTYDRPRIERTLARIRTSMQDHHGAQVLGAHMEGPFISPVYKGAQAEDNITAPDFSWLEPYADIIKVITLAPEQAAGQRFFESCRHHHIILSMGHSAATYEDAREAITRGGVHHVTHLFNAMSPMHHRKPGLVGAALDFPDVMCELICDNLHVHPMLQRLVYGTKGVSGMELITDSMRACLLGDGVSELGGQTVFVSQGEARLADGTLAGSILTMDRAIYNFQHNTGAPLPEIIAMVTENPAQELGLFDYLGSLEEGKYADIVLFDEALRIRQTIIRGNVAYSQQKEEMNTCLGS